MGTSVSKPTISGKDDVAESKLPSTPILAPQFRRLEIDPRSPSTDIARTPIEVLKTPVVRSTINSSDNSLNLTEDLNDLDEVEHNPIDLDPRSPTTEFHRTPIVTDSILKLQTKLHNKNLDNARMPVVTVTPAKPKKLPERVSRRIYGTPEVDNVQIISPKLLDSSPLIVKPAENKRNSIVGLLETNIDFVETNLDEVIQSKVSEMIKLTSDINKTVPAVETEEAKEALNEIVEEILQVDDIVKEINDSNLEVDNEALKNLEDDVVIIDPQLEVNVDNLVEALEEAIKIPNTLTDAENLSGVDELDKKLTNLIYEDKQSNVTPKVNKFTPNHRTPLGDRDFNSQHQRKSIPTLKVSDKPTKPIGAVSKIPVFKEKRIKGKINVQCENTPPRMKPKRSQWSTEDSMII